MSKSLKHDRFFDEYEFEYGTNIGQWLRKRKSAEVTSEERL